MTYKLNEFVTAVCYGGYYLWGEPTKKCCVLEDGESAAWLPTTCSQAGKFKSTECLTPALYEEKCREEGTHARILVDGKMSCEASEGR